MCVYRGGDCPVHWSTSLSFFMVNSLANTSQKTSWSSEDFVHWHGQILRCSHISHKSRALEMRWWPSWYCGSLCRQTCARAVGAIGARSRTCALPLPPTSLPLIPCWIVHAMHICIVQRFLLPLAIGSVCTSLFYGAIYTNNRLSLLWWICLVVPNWLFATKYGYWSRCAHTRVFERLFDW